MTNFDSIREEITYPRKLGRRRTHDNTTPYAIPYRMSAGFPGDVSRLHRAVIEPCVADPGAAYPLQPGMPVVVNTTNNGVRPLVAGDIGLTAIYGIVVRVFPEQQTTGGMTASFGAQPIPGPTVSVLRSGYIMVPIVGSPTKDGPVYIWVTASSTPHVQGGFEASPSGGNTIALPFIGGGSFNGPPDASGIGELIFNI